MIPPNVFPSSRGVFDEAISQIAEREHRTQCHVPDRHVAIAPRDDERMVFVQIIPSDVRKLRCLRYKGYQATQPVAPLFT